MRHLAATSLWSIGVWAFAWMVAAPGLIAQEEASFAGSWQTPSGKLEIHQRGPWVEGSYRRGRLEGRITERRLPFRYVEGNVTGEGELELSEDGQAFQGRWHRDGADTWQSWDGELLQSRSVDNPFAGLWASTYGRLRFNADGEKISGVYSSPPGSRIEGRVEGLRLEFTYQEPEASGKGWFELSEDGRQFAGRWWTEGSERWTRWTGKRVMPEPDRIWLVVLEAHWESGLSEPEYDFGSMLRGYFTMGSARHVSVRQRFFHDVEDLQRFCREVAFLAEPVVLLLSTHGTTEGISVGGRTIGPEEIAAGLKDVPNLELLHLSGCSMMAGDAPARIHAALGDRANFPISGYRTTVAWDASALADFTFLSLLLIHRMSPERAVDQAIRLSPYLGSERIPRSVFRSLGLTIRTPASAEPPPGDAEDR